MTRPYIPVPNTVKLEMCFTQASQLVQNVLHFQYTSDPGVADMEDLAAAIVGWWDLNLKAQSPTNLALRLIRVTNLSYVYSPAIEYTTGLPISGTDGVHAALPNNATVAIKLMTGLRGRSYRGRIFYIGLMSDDVDMATNTVSAGGITFLKDKYEMLYTAAPDWTWGVVSYRNAGAWRETGSFHAITDISINASLDSQRRRLPERGA